MDLVSVVPPDYNKPKEPGVVAGFDAVSIYHIVRAEDTFESAANAVFARVREAHEKYPGRDRVLYIDIEGHKGAAAGFDEDFFEFQQEFLQGFLGPFLRAIAMPLLSVLNPKEQREDLPDLIQIGPPGTP